MLLNTVTRVQPPLRIYDNVWPFVWGCNFMTFSISRINVNISLYLWKHLTLTEERILQPVPIGPSDNWWSSHVNIKLNKICVDICTNCTDGCCEQGSTLYRWSWGNHLAIWFLRIWCRKPWLISKRPPGLYFSSWASSSRNISIPTDGSSKITVFFSAIALMSTTGIPQIVDKKLTNVC